MNNNEYKNNLPLCVDLDGTLIKTDSILEATILAVKKKPLIIFALFFWILKGKNYFKSTILNIAKPDAELFPYNQDVIRLINDAKSNDRAVVLTTASLQDVAEDVSAYLGLFDELIYSTENHNNRSGNKSKTLNDKFGFKKYDYIGNSSADLDVFANCNSAFLVSGNKSLISKSQKVNSNLTV